VIHRLEHTPDLDSLAAAPAPDPEWLEWVGYHPRFSPDSLLEALQALSAQPPHRAPRLLQPGYVINAADLSTNQLRRSAETAIRRGDHQEAERLLEIAQLQRPEIRNISRRLGALRISNPIRRRLALLVTPRFRS
jgi:hypothetical protein